MITYIYSIYPIIKLHLPPDWTTYLVVSIAHLEQAHNDEYSGY